MPIGPAENAGLGPCELQDPVWAKMSALAAGVKKRKKSETKPQAQINKCNNEKRRREQENIYIEELAELISANFADMSSLSVKPDKCAILQETVNQIRSIKQREGGSQSSDPVQQGEVSSSRPAILSTDVYGPLLLEALEGFLFVVNAEGKVEHVTKNVSNYIKYTEEEVLGKSIYNFIHHGDHARFSSSLLPMSIGWASEPTNKSRSFSCRLLVKSSDDPEESVDDKQQHGVRYELMHISSTQLGQGTVNDDESGDSGPCLLCVASRMTYRDRAAFASVDSFTTKLDTTGKIIGVDTSGVSSYCQFLNKDLMGRALQELCAQQDVHKLTQHLRDTLSAGQATSVVYRLRIGQDKFLHVQTKSKLFKSNPHSNETDFIMATHSIMGENDSSRPSDPGGGGGGGGGGNNSNVGGPLMTSVVNGTRNGPPINTTSENSTSINNTLLHNTNSTVYTSFSLENEFIFDNITSNWEIPWQEPRPDSRQSVTPVSTPTPRPPSAPTYSPGTTVAQSPITQFVTQPSPSVPNPSTPANAANLPYNSTFVFSPAPADVEEQKDTKAIVLEEPSTIMADSGRLRTLLTKRQDSADSANDSDKKNRILKTLLNQHDEDENVNESRNSPRGNVSSGRNSISSQSELPKTNTSSGGNNMLLQLLNEKSDDEDREARAGIRKQSELLQQLLKDDEPKAEMPSEDDHLLRSLGFPPSDESRGRKRPSDDRDDTNSKRSSDGVSSSGSSGSKLCERNKMLASLLAKQPNNTQPIPPIPNSVITATPQEKLPRIIPDPNTNKTLPNNNRMIQNMQPQNVLSNARTTARLPGRPSSNTTTYLNQMLTPGDNNIQRSQNRQFNQIDSNSFSSPATSSTETVIWDSQSSDQILSHILDEVLDTVQDDTNILTLLEPSHTNSNSYQQTLNEKIAINRIQKSLMQCETAVNNSPSSPTITLPMTPPAYSTVAMTAQTSQAGFPPPPNYPCNFNVQRAAVRPGVGGAQQYPAGITQQQQQLLYQRKLVQQQQRERDKRRLLQQQQQQQLLIPSNVQVDMQTQDLQNIGSLLNNTVAPNVSLQRSSSVPESQLSPNYGGQTQRLNSQQPYSPHSQLTSPLGQASGFTQTTVSNFQQHGTARLSPHPPAFTQQLSPRQAYPQGTTQNSANWQQNPPRLSVQQQQNPMLNAQLTGNYVAGSNSRNFPVQRAPQQQQRAIGSPGAAAATRHSPFPADTFAPPGSPNSTSFNQNQYLRLQRANSAPTAPTATTQLPGGLGSPRPYGRDHPPHSYPIPQPHHSMMYQQDSQYCYDQTGLQLSYNGADRGRIPPHLQAGVSGSGTTSEYVRQELRNVVGARAGQTQPANNRSQNTLHQAVNSDLDLGGLGYEMPTSGASESPKLWGAMGSDMGSMSPQPATSRTTMEEARQGDHSARSSLLQKLLSE